jgi:hypothetical protein
MIDVVGSAEDDVIMNVIFLYVRRNNIRIFSFKEPVRQLGSDLVRHIKGDFPRRKGLD